MSVLKEHGWRGMPDLSARGAGMPRARCLVADLNREFAETVHENAYNKNEESEEETQKR